MTRNVRKPSEGNVYHVVVRGVSRQIIFEDAQDKKRFLGLLETLLDAYGAQLWAWCLMDNHAHLLLHAPLEDVSLLMQKLQTVYARYFNKRHDRVGTLFQGRFFSTPIQGDSQLAAVIRYIHYNPVRAGGKLANTWSSYKEYQGDAGLCATKKPLSILGGKKGFEALHEADADEQAVKLPRTRIDDDAALAVAKAALGKVNVHDVKALDRDRRDLALRSLKNSGLSVRQISMLTGIGHNIVSRA